MHFEIVKSHFALLLNSALLIDSILRDHNE
jgi:hypothetical protein